MDIIYDNKQLITIEYPGTVQNVNKMTQTLGGEEEMLAVFRNSSKRMELKFRPDDPYCKSVHGDLFNTTNLLLKVIKRTKKKRKDLPLTVSKNTESVLDENVEYKIEFLGVACTSYKFKAIADFQMLPITYDKSKQQYKSLIPDLMPTTLHSASWLDKDVELFIPPLLFSRFDLPQNGYIDLLEKTPKKPEERKLPTNIIGHSRRRRAGFAVFTTFESTDLADTPQLEAVMQLKKYPLEHDLKKRLDELFQERPIWTRNALVGRLKCEKIRFVHALPCVAYYFTNGPWRALWVRFGYNPREDPGSKTYQIMDLRINPNIPINDKKSKKRTTYYSLPNKNTQNQQRVATINTDCLGPTNKDECLDDDDDESKRLVYEYFPGKLPTYRQCFYQLCDIHVEAVQKLIHMNDGKEEFCLEKDGWCLPGTIDKCRELILDDIIKTSKLKGNGN